MKIEIYGNRELLYRKKVYLDANAVHIWNIQWEELKAFWEEHLDILDTAEIQQAKHYRYYEDKMRYIAGKIVTRLLLQQYSGMKELVFRKGKYGKPYYITAPSKRGIQFNISHSGERISAVFSRYHRVGIDVQKIRDIPDYMDIAQNFFAAEEAADIKAAGALVRFYQYWSAKEAYLKAQGIGLNQGMDFFSVRGEKIMENGKKKMGFISRQNKGLCCICGNTGEKKVRLYGK